MGNFISKSLTRTVQRALDADFDSLRQQLAAFEDRDTRQADSLLAQFSALQKRTEETLAQLPKKKIPGGADAYMRLNPEVGLMAYLYSYLPNRVALDIGANIGEVSERLLRAGYEVYAFEPFPLVFEKLQNRHGGSPDFHAARVGLGPTDQTMTLHIAADHSGGGNYDDPTLYSSLLSHAMTNDLVFEGTVEVAVRSLESLHRAGEIPAEVGLVKIDTEGYDLEVIRGMGAQRYPVVLAEFWDPNFVFGKERTLNRLEDLVAEMLGRGYHWFITFYRIEGASEVAFFCNYSQSLDRSWGNVCFFQDHSLYQRARDWCALNLPEALIAP